MTPQMELRNSARTQTRPAADAVGGSRLPSNESHQRCQEAGKRYPGRGGKEVNRSQPRNGTGDGIGTHTDRGDETPRPRLTRSRSQSEARRAAGRAGCTMRSRGWRRRPPAGGRGAGAEAGRGRRRRRSSDRPERDTEGNVGRRGCDLGGRFERPHWTPCRRGEDREEKHLKK